MTNWLKFAGIQLVSAFAMVAGWVLLIPPCLLKQWGPCPSPLPPARWIDQWSWHWLNKVYGNPENGVSGECAIVNGAPYMPTANSIWRAYCWSAWRNSCNNLKYVFAAPAPDYRYGTFTVFGKEFYWLVGWKLESGVAVPIMSVGAGRGS